MSTLQNKKILVAISAGIAAYKSIYLVRSLVKKGAEVRVILTPDAKSFVTPLTLATLSKNPVESEFSNAKGDWNNHVALGMWADLMIIAPMTAKTLSSMAHGHCDNLVQAVYLSARCPVFVAPAMDLDMYQHPTTQENLTKIEKFGNIIIPAVSGELASGLSGQGRMEEPEKIIEFVEDYLSEKLILKNKKILISAGPTYEALDPVRFIGNHSSGKMGFELAKMAAKYGAEVTLVAGPSSEIAASENIQRIDVTSALEMLDAIEQVFDHQDVVIMSAAVSDYRPMQIADKKIKKNSDEMNFQMVKNPDILKHLGTKKDDKILVGFALETNDAIENAKGKLKNKNADLIVLNTLEDKDAGFKVETNKVTFITADKEPIEFPVKSKTEVAKDILNFIAQNFIKNA